MKLYYVYKIIKESKVPISAKEILACLNEYGIMMDIKTVYSSIKKINEFYYCFTDKSLIKTIRRSGYIIDECFFDDGQLQLLIDSVIFNPNLDRGSSKQLVDKLLSLSSINQIERLNIDELNNKELSYDLLLNLTTILKAINHHKNISFKYISYDVVDNNLQEIFHTNGNLNKETYIISPYKLILRGSNYYLIGYFNKREDSLSVYRVDRMRLVRKCAGHYEDIQEQFDMEKEFDNNVNMYLGKQYIKLKIIFNHKVLREVVNQFGKEIVVSKRYDGKIEAVIDDVVLSDGLIGWLMMLQDNIQIVYPLDLKEIVKNRLITMLNMYKTED